MDRRKVCRYFERGSCKKEKCPFVHLRENRKNCQFFMQGFCKKGANCNFYHPPKENEEQKVKRENYKPTIHKKQINVEQKEEQEEDTHEKQDHNHHENEEQHDEIEQKVEQKVEKTVNMQQHVMNEQYKRQQINFLLGLGEHSSSDQSENEQQTKVVMQPKRKPLNFVKIYPKKFPDYTKSVESKQKILENEKLYFKDRKFAELISKIQQPVQRQHFQLVRKFQDSYTEVPNESEQKLQQNKKQMGKCFTINLRPLLYEPEVMLHFEMIQDYIQLKIDATKYPTGRAKFQILNISIPEQYKHKFVQFLNKTHSAKTIVQTLKVFVNHFEKIYEQSKSKLQNQYYSQIELQEKINKKLSQEKQRKQMKKERKQKKSKQEKPQAKAQNPDVQIIKFNQNEKITVGNMSYEIKLDSLLINNAQYVVAERFLLYIQCQCQKQLVHILEADRKELKIGVKLRCKKCLITISIAIQREVMQLRSQIIGRLGIENGRLKQIGGVSWKIGCSCDAQIIKSRICLPGTRLTANCFQCFRQMQVSYMGLGFTNPFFKQAQNIENGKQLPNRGSCKHMKLSFRWFRYGCCGRRFSCDECHTNESVYPHDKLEGATMLCGFCSYEQPVGKECLHCRKELVRGVDKSGHWEGGLGCRDKTLLSRKDAKKYAGLTKSNKQK